MLRRYTFASGGPDNIKQWKCPDGKFIQNLSGHNAIVNCLGMNDDGVLVSGGELLASSHPVSAHVWWWERNCWDDVLDMNMV